MTDYPALKPPYHEPMDTELSCHLANDRIAELEAELEIERGRLAACGVAALGYFDGCKDEYRSASLEDVLKLRSDFDAEREKRERAEWAMCDLCHTKYHKETAEQASSAGRRVVREFGEALDKLAEQGATDE